MENSSKETDGSNTSVNITQSTMDLSQSVLASKSTVSDITPCLLASNLSTISENGIDSDCVTGTAESISRKTSEMPASLETTITFTEDNSSSLSQASPIKRCRVDSVPEETEQLVTSQLSNHSAEPDREKEVTVEEEEGRSLRRLRKKSLLDGQGHVCPVCGITLRPSEMAWHLTIELDRVDKLIRPGKKSGIKGAAACGGKVHPGNSSSAGGGSLSGAVASNSGGSGEGRSTETAPANASKRYQSYLRVKADRQNRLCAVARSKKKKKPPEETTCPVCEKNVVGTPEELNEHVDLCLKKREDEEAAVDVEGDDDFTYEEYEWAGQTRIRATTLLPGGLAASGFPTVSKVKDEDENVDLDVDGDDEQSFGQPQYSEKDVILCSADAPEENKERLALRRAYLKTEMQSVDSEPTNRSRWEIKTPKGKSKSSAKPNSSSQDNNQPTCSYSSEVGSPEEFQGGFVETSTSVIDSLKAKIRDQQKLLDQERPTCLICMEPYQVPVTSVQCWHVHCEECWLRTLGTKKVCPQCNIITHASDLRRIFL